MERRPTYGSTTVIVERGSRNSRVVEIDVEGTNPVSTWSARARENDTGVGDHPQ